jgi:hypothetical protein
VAAGANPAATRKGGRSPFDYLAARQAGDGHYRYSAASDQTPVWVTGQALLAVERRALPLRAVGRAKAHGRARTQGAAPAEGSDRGDGSTGGPGGGSIGGRREGGRGIGRRAPGEQGSSQRAASAEPRLSGAPASATGSAGSASEGDGGTTLYVAGGFAVLGAALVGGFLVYRRRLP